MNTAVPVSLRHQIREKLLYTKWIPVMASCAQYFMAGLEGIKAISKYVA